MDINTNQQKIDEFWMQHCIKLAENGFFTTQPNPRVGCVIINDNQIIAEGMHLKRGEAHAEAMALKKAGSAASGATCYVTLEPCSHYGLTPPCAEALVKAGVSRVVIGMIDPNPIVAGKGIAILKAANIAVTAGILESEVRALNAGYIKRMETGRPYVRVKLAMSLDGNIACHNGQSQWLTNRLSRSDVQQWRAMSCAVITGANTITEDDPSLNVRWNEMMSPVDAQFQRQPLRIIVDTNARTKNDAKILSLEGSTIMASCTEDTQKRQSWMAAGGQWLTVNKKNEKVDLSDLLSHLGKMNCNEVLVEAGSELCGAFTREGLVDEYIIYISPKFIGHSGKSLLNLDPIDSLSECKQLNFKEVTPLAGDLRVIATLQTTN